MGTRLETSRGSSLYDFWGDAITELLNSDIDHMKEKVVINCASQEYSKVVKREKLNAKMLTVSFKQKKNDIVRTIAIYAKRARGMFANYLVRHRLTKIDELITFNSDGYCFSPDRSDKSELVFLKILDE